jgi:hypothetical protein
VLLGFVVGGYFLFKKGGLDGVEKKYPKLRFVKVVYSDGSKVETSMAAHLSDSDIKEYFRIGKKFNIGNAEDKIVSVKKVVILE